MFKQPNNTDYRQIRPTNLFKVYPNNAMRRFKIQPQQLVIQPDNQAELQVSDVPTSSDTIASPNSRNIIPLTYSQELYQFQTRKKFEGFEETLEPNTLKNIKRLLEKLFELN